MKLTSENFAKEVLVILPKTTQVAHILGLLKKKHGWKQNKMLQAMFDAIFLRAYLKGYSVPKSPNSLPSELGVAHLAEGERVNLLRKNKS